MLAGIDLSAWQEATPPLAGRAFVLARATYGLTPDARFAQHAAATLAAGAVLGAYHFGISGPTPEAQAAAFLAAVGGRTRWLMLDLEAEQGKVPMSAAEAHAFLVTVQGTGRRCGLYHSLSGYPDIGQSWRAVADWGATPPPIPWDIWQYGTDPELHVDGDRYAGDLAGLRWLADLEDDVIYTLGGLRTGIVQAGTPYYTSPGDPHPRAAIAATRRYFLLGVDSTGGWVALDGLYDAPTGTTPELCGWVPISAVSAIGPACPPPPKPVGLAVRLDNGTTVPVPG